MKRVCPARRITPAWAGNSMRVFYERFRQGDHPRVGGE